ncbi:MAG: hypothetical protein MI746_13000 [Pseudomonadales bacterium]|nr:hypothetical protein [Pseudomonadales bacterium]
MQFPTVLVTLVSIIQALALELMWGKITEADYLWEWGIGTIVAWGTITVTLLGILQIWVLYSTLIIGFTWRPTLRDSILPFVLGIQEFMLVTFISEEFNALWLYVLASLFLFANYIAHISFRRARAEPDNEPFFRDRPPATWRDFRWSFTVITSFCLLGILHTALGNPDWVALTAIVFANFALAVQVVSSRSLWRAILETED